MLATIGQQENGAWHCPSSISHADGQTRVLPIGKARVQSLRAVTATPQERNRFVGVDAEWAPTVGDDRPPARQPAQAALQLLNRNRPGAEDVARPVFGLWPDVEHHD